LGRGLKDHGKSCEQDREHLGQRTVLDWSIHPMLTTAGVWFLILFVVLAFMAIKNSEPKTRSMPKQQPIKPPVIPRPRPTHHNQTHEQRLSSLQADYQRKLALLQRAIPDPVHRRLAEQELYARYLAQIKEWIG